MFEKLMKDVEWAKTIHPSIIRQNLFQTLGRIEMAWELDAITKEEYMQLYTACCTYGTENPKYYTSFC